MGTIAMTGGATGIGAATKQQLLNAGHQVIVVDIRDADIIADLSTVAGRNAAVEGIRKAAPEGLDGLVPCAGLGPAARPFSLITRVNYFGVLAVVEGLRDLLAMRRGSVVLISSNSAPMALAEQAFVDMMLAGDEQAACDTVDGRDATTAYGAGKLALTRWMRRNTAAWAADGIRLNAVAPGITRTPLTDSAHEDPVVGQAMKDFAATVPLGEVAEPRQIAEGICFLLSDAADFIAGSVLFIDGGHDAMLRPDDF